MTRKTNNSSQTLTNATEALAMGNTPDYGQTRQKIRKSSRTLRPTNKSSMGGRSVGGNGAEDGVHPAEDDGVEATAELEEAGEPAAIAPSVRATIETDEQAGLPDTLMKDDTVFSTIEQDGEEHNPAHPVAQSSRHGSDANVSDEDYAAVNDISDSSGSEAGAEAGAEQDILQDAMDDLLRHPRIKDSHFDNAFESKERYYSEEVSEPDFTAMSSMAGDYNDFEEWEGIPNTPVNASTPQLGHATVPSTRRVHFKLQASDRQASEVPENDGTNPGTRPESFKLAQATSRGGHGGGSLEEASEPGADDSGSGSGYETDDGGTTDEEEPPKLPQGLYKPPHLLRRSSLSSLDTSATSYVYTPTALEKPFKLPSAPASHHRKGPRLGTFTVSSSRSYAVMDQTASTLLVRRATRPSPLSTPRRSRVGSVTSNSAPQTPVLSQATLAVAADLSDTEFSDAAASMTPVDPISMVSVPADPVLSMGPDFVASAGFTKVGPRAVNPAAPLTNNSMQAPWCFPMDTDFGVGQSTSQAGDDDAISDLEGMIADLIDYPSDSSSEDEASIEDEVSMVLASSLASGDLDFHAQTVNAQLGLPTASPTSSSTINMLNATLADAPHASKSRDIQPAAVPNGGTSVNGKAQTGSMPMSPPSTDRKRKRSGSPSSDDRPVQTSKRQLLTT